MRPARRVALLVCAATLALSSCGGSGSSGRSHLVREAAVAPSTTETTVPETTTEAPTTTTSAAPVTTSTAPPPPPTTPSTVAAASSGPVAVAAPPKPTRRPAPVVANPPRPIVGSIESYSGLGTWVDVYDWSHYKNSTPTVGPDQVDQMADEGVQTLFLQTAKNDTPDAISEPELLLPIIKRAHERGIRVVGWYLPTLEDTTNDLNRLVASANLDVDGLAVDIESRKVADIDERNRRLVDLSAQLRNSLPGRAIGAIVLPPVVLEVVNPSYWPNFPYHDITPFYDVWQPMGYWTNRKVDSGYRDPYRYTDENIKRLRADLGQPEAPVHPVGGIGVQSGDDVNAFLKAVAENGSIGASVYDWRTTNTELWASLRQLRSG